IAAWNWFRSYVLYLSHPSAPILLLSFFGNLSGNSIRGAIPSALGKVTNLQVLNLNGDFLSGRVPATLGGRLLHRASF
ncbi:hypothetical protein S83_060106, partial [Arachis hypogaea]